MNRSVFLPLTARWVAPAFDLATRVFCSDSTLHKALGVDLDAYRRYLLPSFDAMVGQGLSVLAVDPRDDRVLGCLIATDFSTQGSVDPQESGMFAPIAALTSQLSRDYAAKRGARPGDAVLVDMAVVAQDATGLGLYQGMRDAAHRVAKSRGYRYVVGELSSAVTQRVVLGKLGHRTIAEIRFEQFEFDGHYPFRSIKDPGSIILAEGRL